MLSTQLAVLHKRQEELEAQAGRIADAIAVAGHSPALLTRLATAEAELARVTQEIATHKPVNVTATIADIQEFVRQNVMQLRNLLRKDAPTARAALMKHIKQLVLTPEDRPTGPVFQVSGGVEVLNPDVMPVVARAGWQPLPGLIPEARLPGEASMALHGRWSARWPRAQPPIQYARLVRR